MADAALDAALARAAALLRDADALLIGAGAGIGVDSGLPDFRGDQGFWKAYPPLARLGIRFVEIANPRSFAGSPELAWGFYGHCLALYRATVPHEGFAILRGLASRMAHGAFVFTSNVDGQYERFGRWRARVRRPVVIELGAGTDVPSVRRLCESDGAPLIRINPREPDVAPGTGVGIAAGALGALRGLRELLP